MAAAQVPSSASRAELFQVSHVELSGCRYAYRLLEPLPHLRSSPHPLVVFLHDADQRGDDNEAQCGLLPHWLAERAQREALPCFVLALQCPQGEKWVEAVWSDPRDATAGVRATRATAAVLQAIDAVLARPGIDSARVYLTGVGMGGFGAFDLAAREPDRFAALLMVSGGGDPATMPRLVGLPCQIWHGADDTVVMPQRSRELAEAGRAIGAPVKYYEIEGAGSDVWRQAYDSAALAWLFAQDHRQQGRGAFARTACVPRLDQEQLTRGWFHLQRGGRCFAPASTQAVAALFLNTLRVTPVLRPGLTAMGAPAAGDVVLRLDSAMREAFVLTVDEQFEIVARDAGCLRAAAAAASQLLCTGPGGACPRGRFARSALTGGGIVLPPGTDWPTSAVQRVLRAVWWVGGDELVLPTAGYLVDLAEATRATVLAEAERYGVTLTLAGQRRSRPGELDLTGRTVNELLRLAGGGSGPQPFVLAIPALPTEQALLSLPWLAAAAAERSAHSHPIHAGEFWSRLGHLQR